MSFVDALFNVFSVPTLEQGFGVPVTLTHGPNTTEEFTALWRDQTYNVTDSEGFVTSYQSRDFEFAKSDAVIGTEEFEPRAGDVIDLTENEEAVKYEVVPMGNMPAVGSMPGGYRWKVHTQRVQ